MPPKGELLDRSNKQSNLLGSLTYIGLRALDPLLQYQLLRHTGTAILSTLHISTIPSLPTSTSTTLHGPFDLSTTLPLSPYRVILLALTTAASAKHILWKLFLGQESMPPFAGAFIGIYNSTFTTLNTLLFLASFSSPITSATTESFPLSLSPSLSLSLSTLRSLPTPLLLGTALTLTNLALELTAETQRHIFKSDPSHAGKPYTEGLFGVARHINYGTYTLWRAGMALASGGWAWAALTTALLGRDFAGRAVPALDKYCEERYGDAWRAYRARTTWKLVPWVY